MAKRGRPSKYGVKDGVALVRGWLVLEGFGRSRSKGNKYEVALLEAVQFVKEQEPGLPISTAEVKRVLKDLYPENGREGPSTHEIVRSGRNWTLREIRPRTEPPAS